MIKFSHIIVFSFLLVSLVMSSCSSDDYINSIPKESTALLSLDIPQLANSEGMLGKQNNILKSLFHIDDVSHSGLDVEEKVYMFESSEGNLGLCAKVNDEDDLTNTFENLAKKGFCSKIVKRRGFHFTVIKDSWVAGYSENALLVMGPVVMSAQMDVQQEIAKYLSQEEEEGIKESLLYSRLDSMAAPFALVAQATALPEKFIAPFTLGAPKDADASQIMLAADISTKNHSLIFQGETFSFNKRIDDSLKKAIQVYRPIKGQYVHTMPSSAILGMFLNVDGTKFLPLMQNDKAMVALLAGLNSAVDMDNIIRSVDGDMAIVSPNYSSDHLSLSMSAKLAHAKWLDDVDYWKQSCPKGGSISDWRKNAFYYRDAKTSYYFGVTSDLQYYSGSSAELADLSILPSPKAMNNDLVHFILGKKMVLVVNLKGVDDKNNPLAVVSSLIEPLFGKINTLVYSLK